MKEKRKKLYIGVCVFLVIFSCGLIIIAGKLTESRNLTENRNITIDEFVDTGHQVDIDEEELEKHKQNELEIRMQETIQLMVEDCDSLVSIYNYDSADDSAATVAVTLYTEHGNDISEEQQESVERFVSGCFDRLPESSITINVKASENSTEAL